MKTTLLLVGSLLSLFCYGQDVAQQLNTAVKKLEADSQFKHAIISMYVVESKTGKVVFDKNAQIGLAPASCQKVITSVSAFEMLGKEYRYKTELWYRGEIKEGQLDGDLYLTGYGDPTLGSWRYPNTTAQILMTRWVNTLKQRNITSLFHFAIDDSRYSSQLIPGGWPWEDVGNYYGAGCGAINWRENQFDLILKAGDVAGQPVQLIEAVPKDYFLKCINELKTGSKSSGDNAYLYLPVTDEIWVIKGTVPAGEKRFKISGAIINPSSFLDRVFNTQFDSAKITIKKVNSNFTVPHNNIVDYTKRIDTANKKILDYHYSPSLDSINYWFLKKSINLYGEAFVKTIAYEKTKFGSTDTGIAIIKDFWSKRGIGKAALNIIDGSGLSPANRVTTNALVTVMQYAKKQNWYGSFYNALPEMNGIKMKDGYISGVRSYTGYLKSKTGTEYTFSFIVNNFSGSAGSVREKMWKVLDILK